MHSGRLTHFPQRCRPKPRTAHLPEAVAIEFEASALGSSEEFPGTGGTMAINPGHAAFALALLSGGLARALTEMPPPRAATMLELYQQLRVRRLVYTLARATLTALSIGLAVIAMRALI